MFYSFFSQYFIGKSPCHRAGNVLHGAGKVSNCARNVSYGVGKVLRRCHILPGGFCTVLGKYDMVPGRCHMVPGRCHMVQGRLSIVPGMCHMVPGMCHMVPKKVSHGNGKV